MSLHSIVGIRYDRYHHIFDALESLITRIVSSEYIIVKENKKISYETKGYRLWIRFRKNKTVIEYYNPSRKDYDLWYINQYLGHIIAGKYSRILFYVAAFIALVLVSWSPSYANFAIIIVGLFIALDYVLHAYYNWSLVKQHNEAYHNIPAYRTLYERTREEILDLISKRIDEPLRTTVFLNKTWFKKTASDSVVLSKYPI